MKSSAKDSGKKVPCPVLDPVEMLYIPPVQEVDGYFMLVLVDHHHLGVIRKVFSKDPKNYCPRCQTDHIQYQAIEKMKMACCEEPIMIAEYFFVGPTGPVHTRCTHDHSEE
jgi:hypothetical protein